MIFIIKIIFHKFDLMQDAITAVDQAILCWDGIQYVQVSVAPVLLKIFA